MIQNFTDSVRATNEQYAEIQRRRLSTFHPSLEGIVDDINILTSGLRLRPFPRNRTLTAELDADSIYFISTDPEEILDLVIMDSVSMVHFKSLTSRGDANIGSRFCIAGNEDVILPRVRVCFQKQLEQSSQQPYRLQRHHGRQLTNIAN
jgi:hypothetical protein